MIHRCLFYKMVVCKRQKTYNRDTSADFRVCDGLGLPFENEFDVVFSNAVFHWISDHDTLLKNIHKVLKPQGLLVCEFGAAGNISTIEHAFSISSREICYHTV